MNFAITEKNRKHLLTQVDNKSAFVDAAIRLKIQTDKDRAETSKKNHFTEEGWSGHVVRTLIDMQYDEHNILTEDEISSIGGTISAIRRLRRLNGED
tara:strand:- start:222 stop:512 length:291 start_codon:yes stop_codon:yes gene_type:complete